MKKYRYLLAFLALVFSFSFFASTASAKKNFTISPKTTLKTGYRNSESWNTYTKHYFTLRTYLEKLEKAGGGTLTLKKGTYKISNTLYVSSNITIKFQNGVKLIKLNKTGKAKFKPAGSMFQIVPNKLSKTEKQIGEYNGSQNVKFIGSGNVTIDLKSIKDAKAIMAAHCENIEISQIRFCHMNTGHFLEVDATRNITIQNCSFQGVTANTKYTKEAINLDTPDDITNGLHLPWSISDKTPNVDVTIKNCKFSDLNRGIGTHNYSQLEENGTFVPSCQHENIVIENNSFTNMKNTGVFMMNWKNVTLNNNTFKKNELCTDFRGVIGLSVHGNDFGSSTVTSTRGKDNDLLYYNGYVSPNTGDNYSPIYNDLGFTTLTELLEQNDA